MQKRTRGHKARGYEPQCNVNLVAAGFMPACFGHASLSARARCNSRHFGLQFPAMRVATIVLFVFVIVG